MSVIGTSSSSSTEAWLVQPEPDTWLALSASTTTSLGLEGASSATAGDGGAAEADEEGAASGAAEQPDAASAPATSAGTSLWNKQTRGR